MNTRLLSRPRLAAALGLLLVSTGPLAARVFTDRQGREIEAEITAVSGPNVTLRLANGKTYTIPVEKLSDSDRLFVEVWEDPGNKAAPGDGKSPETPAAVPSNIKYSIAIEADKERLAKRDKIKDGTGEVTPEDWVYEVVLRNQSGVALEGVEMSYRIYVEPEASSKTMIEAPKYYGFLTKLEPLADKAQLKLKTDKVVINELELDGDYEFTDGSRNRLKDDLEGIWIKLWHGGHKVAEFKSSNSTVKKAVWPDDEPAQPEENAGG
jgi:hypothetical protein